MSSELRGRPLPTPKYCLAALSPDLETIAGYRALQTYFPTVTDVFDIPKRKSHEFNFDTKWRIVGLNMSEKGPGNGKCLVTIVSNDVSGAEQKTQTAYVKVTHLLDPIRWMQNKYSLPKEVGLPAPTKSWKEAWKKLQDPSNQAYVEVMASYAVGKLREKNYSPHFNYFFGSFCSIADSYFYDITEELDSFQHCRWFWAGKKKGIYSLNVRRGEEEKKTASQSFAEGIIEEKDFADNFSNLESDSDSDSSEYPTESLRSENLGEISHGGVADIVSLHSDDMESLSFASEASSDSDSDSQSTSDSYEVHANLKNFPVMLLCMENNENTMDSLMSSEPYVEEKWTAWLFQVIVALSQIQCLFGFTHNDLHTNNILFIQTDAEFLYYKGRNGQVWKVPTYGKIFRIIDFGRAIFKLNEHTFISDDFSEGNEAEGQYAFEPLVSDPKVVINPNPSFDLCRLAVSLFDGLFPTPPAEKEGGRILNNESGMVIRETESELCNMLWEWMIDDDNKNILISPDGSERFPSFDLYRHIARYIHNAVPSKQLERAMFQKFKTDLATTETCYPMFV